MKRIEQVKAAVPAAAFGLLATPAWAGGGGFARIQTVFDNVNTSLIAAGVVIMTTVILWVGWKVAFSGATFQDMSKPLIGGIILGTAPVLAGFLMS